MSAAGPRRGGFHRRELYHVTRRQPTATRAPAERAGVVGVFFSSRERSRAEESLEELKALAQAAGAEVLVQPLQERPAPDPACFVGKGKVEELRAVVENE